MERTYQPIRRAALGAIRAFLRAWDTLGREAEGPDDEADEAGTVAREADSLTLKPEARK